MVVYHCLIIISIHLYKYRMIWYLYMVRYDKCMIYRIWEWYVNVSMGLEWRKIMNSIDFIIWLNDYI